MIPELTVQAVLFDLDGTLVDAFPPIIHALNQTLQEFGRPTMTPEAIKRHTGRGEGGMSTLFAEDRDKALVRFLELHDALYLQQITTIAGSEALLTWLKEKAIPMAVVTSKGQHRAEAQIKLLGWQHYFHTIVGRIDGRPEKPSPVPVQMACHALNSDSGQSIMIGDGIADMKAGTAAGLFTIGVVDSFSEEELKEHGASCCFYSLNEVQQWLQKKIS